MAANPVDLQSLQNADVIQHSSDSTKNPSKHTSANLISRNRQVCKKNSTLRHSIVNEAEKPKTRFSIIREQTALHSVARCAFSQSVTQTKPPADHEKSSCLQLSNNSGRFSTFEVEDNKTPASTNIGTQTCNDPRDHLLVNPNENISAGGVSLSGSVDPVRSTSITPLRSEQPSSHSSEVIDFGVPSVSSIRMKNYDNSTIDVRDCMGDKSIKRSPQKRENVNGKQASFCSSQVNGPGLPSVNNSGIRKSDSSTMDMGNGVGDCIMDIGDLTEEKTINTGNTIGDGTMTVRGTMGDKTVNAGDSTLIIGNIVGDSTMDAGITLQDGNRNVEDTLGDGTMDTEGILQDSNGNIDNALEDCTTNVEGTIGKKLTETIPQLNDTQWVVMPSSALRVPQPPQPPQPPQLSQSSPAETNDPKKQTEPPKDKEVHFVTLKSSHQPGIAFKAIPLSALQKGTYVRSVYIVNLVCYCHVLIIFLRLYTIMMYK